MALTYTPEGAIHSPMPKFTLSDVEGKPWRVSDFKDRTKVVMFICNHCPYVRAIEDRLLDLARAYQPRTAFFAICANDPSDHPEDEPAALRQRWRDKHYPFPYLIDPTQQTARAFGAVCTPDLYVYTSDDRLVYRGRLDDSWRDPGRVQRQELKGALDQVLAGHTPPKEQNPSMGCSIKWLRP